MKNSYRYLLKFSNGILAVLLTLFGIACSNDDDPPAPEYGTPYAKFTVKGKVISGKQAFKVSFHDIDGEENGFYHSTTVEIAASQVELTGENGRFEGEGEITLDISLKERKTEVDAED